jgi:hydroxymethylpyrimidine pyrophosphatase-like HAD family hydrolase
VKERYRSASAVTAVDVSKLRDQMHSEEICMIFLLIEAPDEQLMAYQHTQRNSFFTTKGVDKLYGSLRMAETIGFDMASSIGAGDTELDRFLNGVALAMIVGSLDVGLKGLRDTVRLKNSLELGQVLFELSEKIGKGAHV